MKIFSNLNQYGRSFKSSFIMQKINPYLFLFLIIIFLRPGSYAQNTSINFSQATNALPIPSNPTVTWIYGVLNQHNSQYGEGMAVPQRVILENVKKTNNNEHELVFRAQFTRSRGSTTVNAFDFLASWQKAVDNGFGTLSTLFTEECTPHAGQIVPALCGDNTKKYTGVISGDVDDAKASLLGTDFTSYFDAPFVRNFTMYSSAALDGAPSIVRDAAIDPAGSNSYAVYRVKWKYAGATPVNNSTVIIEFAAHLAKTISTDPSSLDFYLGAGHIRGAPYHLKLDKLDGGNIGSQDNQVKVGDTPAECELPDCDISGPTEVCCNTTATYSFCDDEEEGVIYTWSVTEGEAEITGGQGTHEVTIDTKCKDFVLSLTVSRDGVADCSEEHDISVTVIKKPDDCSDDLYECEQLLNRDGTTPAAYFDLTKSKCEPEAWYTDADFTDEITNPGNYLGHDGDVVYGKLSNDCGNGTATVTLHVNPLPTFGTITPSATCSGTSNGSIVLSSCESGVSYQLQTCSGDDVQDAKTCGGGGTITWTGLAAGSYKIAATNTETECTNTSGCVTVGAAYCNNTLTQGFYGNQGGKDCNGKVAIDIMKAAVGLNNNVKFGNQNAGLAGCKSFTLKYSDLTTSDGGKLKIYKMLPGGSTPAVLGCTNLSACGAFQYTATYDCASSWPNVVIQPSGPQKGSINNILLAQTMTLFFNLSNSGTLGAIILSGNKLTFNNLGCNSSTPGSFSSYQYIPCPVLTYLIDNYTVAGQPNINNLYDLANKVLGGVVTIISASEMNDALNAINVGFDKGKALVNQELVNCTPVTRSSQVITGEVVPVKDMTVLAYPNPFSNTVNFQIKSPVTGKAELEIYNVAGQKIKTISQEYLLAEQTQLIRVDLPPSVSSAVLIYKLKMGDRQVTGKLIQIAQ